MEMRLQLVLVHDTSPMTRKEKKHKSQAPWYGKTVPLLGLHRSFCIRIFCKKNLLLRPRKHRQRTTMATKLCQYLSDWICTGSIPRNCYHEQFHGWRHHQDWECPNTAGNWQAKNISKVIVLRFRSYYNPNLQQALFTCSSACPFRSGKSVTYDRYYFFDIDVPG